MCDRNRGMLLIIFCLFFLSCDDDFPDPDLRGHYYVKSEYPVVVSMNDLHKDDKLFITSDEVDYYFTVYRVEKLHENCIKINSDVKQNIHIEMTLKTARVKIDIFKEFDIYDDNFEYCY